MGCLFLYGCLLCGCFNQNGGLGAYFLWVPSIQNASRGQFGHVTLGWFWLVSCCSCGGCSSVWFDWSVGFGSCDSSEAADWSDWSLGVSFLPHHNFISPSSVRSSTEFTIWCSKKFDWIVKYRIAGNFRKFQGVAIHESFLLWKFLTIWYSIISTLFGCHSWIPYFFGFFPPLN